MLGAIGAAGAGGRIGVDPGVEGAGKTLEPGAAHLGDGPGFTTVLDQIVSGVAGALKTGEKVAAEGVLGTGSVQATVESVMAAEQSLQVGIGIRDRIVNAYLELSRMAI
jgi:flagellar hook-basal body complex protein FliE